MTFWKRRRRQAADDGGDNRIHEPSGEPDAPDGASYETVLGHPVISIGRKELYEDGFDFCGPLITAAFADAGLDVELDDQADPPDDIEIDEDEIIRWLWVDDECLIEQYGVTVEVQLGGGATTRMRALDWDLVTALRQRFHDRADPTRNWHLGDIDDGYLLILANPSQLDDIAAAPDFPGFGVVDLTGATEVRRFEE